MTTKPVTLMRKADPTVYCAACSKRGAVLLSLSGPGDRVAAVGLCKHHALNLAEDILNTIKQSILEGG